MITRRTSERRPFMTPCPRVRNHLLYCYGLYLQEFPNITVAAFCFLATHLHELLNDPNAEVSLLMHRRNSMIARSMNVELNRGESFWGNKPFSRIELVTEEQIWKELVYVASQPVKDGLVARPEDWPGLISLPEDVGTKVFEAYRPDVFFKQTGAAAKPERVSFTLQMPPELAYMGLEAFKAEYRRRLNERLAEIHQERREAGKTEFLGVEAILRQPPLEPLPNSHVIPERRLNPALTSAVDREINIAQRRGLTEWRRQYRQALAAWRRDDRTVLFPWGTFWMRVYFNAGCDGPSPLVEY